MKIHILLFFFFSFLGVVLSILFIFKKSGNQFSNRILSIYTLLFSYEIAYNSLYWTGKLNAIEYVHFNKTHYLLWLLYGPLVYIYIRSILKNIGFKISDVLFLIPVSIMFFSVSKFYFLDAETKLEVLNSTRISDYILLPNYVIWVILSYMFSLGIFTYIKFKNHIKVGFKEKIWFNWFIASFLGYVFLFTLYIFLIRFKIMDPKYDYFIDTGIVFFIAMLTYFGFMQPDLFNGIRPLSKIIPIYTKYSKSGLSKALAEDLKNKLHMIIIEQKPYLNCDLRLDELAAMINASRNHTSQIINEYYNLSFFDFINKYRIEEAKTLLRNQKENNLTITSIAFEAGFNNRASFYKAFKKFTHQNPSTFVKHLVAS